MLSVPLKKGESTTPLRIINQLERALERLEQHGQRPEDNIRTYAQTVLDTVVDVPCAILVANNHGRFIVANDAAVALTGYTRAELVQMSVWDLTPASSVSAGQSLWSGFLEQGRMRGIYDIRRKDRHLVRTKYVALANVLPGLHLSALIDASKAHKVRLVRPNIRPKRTA